MEDHSKPATTIKSYLKLAHTFIGNVLGSFAGLYWPV